jgi:hypothetical protein
LKVPEDEWLKDVVAKAKEILAAGENECLVTVTSAMGIEKLTTTREGNKM